MLLSSFQLNCLHWVGNCYVNKSILDLRLFVFKSIGYLCPIFDINSIARGNSPPNWGYQGCSCIEKTPLRGAGIFVQGHMQVLWNMYISVPWSHC